VSTYTKLDQQLNKIEQDCIELEEVLQMIERRWSQHNLQHIHSLAPARVILKEIERLRKRHQTLMEMM